ncbi:hypothetical protein ElyMa_005066500 [Elysia marginata]|uniref:Uncharacterized protein n=1 Tax=Elysia marginata TaxID=1093978 RepID=A0AAV4JJS6_9GAST|nr:hypothetical protein ElyMa_005066500 [Elysia marginata]
MLQLTESPGRTYFNPLHMTRLPYGRLRTDTGPAPDRHRTGTGPAPDRHRTGGFEKNLTLYGNAPKQKRITGPEPVQILPYRIRAV